MLHRQVIRNKTVDILSNVLPMPVLNSELDPSKHLIGKGNKACIVVTTSDERATSIGNSPLFRTNTTLNIDLSVETSGQNYGTAVDTITAIILASLYQNGAWVDLFEEVSHSFQDGFLNDSKQTVVRQFKFDCVYSEKYDPLIDSTGMIIDALDTIFIEEDIVEADGIIDSEIEIKLNT
ncbi:hypothetical protein [Novispirillum itersonii]|uniref:hypothetical protein n=1 Tax=Novispirillum itersonii TaxID=189 RepID=UPI00037830BB|nr:hypothetical protein [Novispirillum itersonii]